MQKFGLIGYPLGHSFSPGIHEKIYESNHIDATYSLLEIKPEQLNKNVFAEFAQKFDGINVTIPHKTEIMRYLDDISDEAQQIGAVNTIKKFENKWIGYNTDVYGFLYPIKHNIKNKIETCLVLGTGGAAMAAIYAIVKYIQPQRLTIAGRSKEKALKLKDKYGKINNTIEIGAEDKKEVNKFLSVADLVVNATSVGMYPVVNESVLAERFKLKNQAIVYDLIYNPAETKLLKQAKLNNPDCKTINGLEMLIAQAARAVEIWTGKTVPIKNVINALDFAEFQHRIDSYLI